MVSAMPEPRETQLQGSVASSPDEDDETEIIERDVRSLNRMSMDSIRATAFFRRLCFTPSWMVNIDRVFLRVLIAHPSRTTERRYRGGQDLARVHTLCGKRLGRDEFLLSRCPIPTWYQVSALSEVGLAAWAG